jgi:hypothetical protein
MVHANDLYVCLQERPEANTFFNKIHELLSTVPVINWFVRDPPPGLGGD